MIFTAGAMAIMDTEPLDGQDYKNGVLGYITLVCWAQLVLSAKMLMRLCRAWIRRKFTTVPLKIPVSHLT